MNTTPDKESPYAIGVGVSCTDGECGHLHRIIIDPESKALTHLVVGPDAHGARPKAFPLCVARARLLIRRSRVHHA